MSCGQCIRKVLKAAEPLTKHTHAHTHCHTHSHTATPRHHTRHHIHNTETKAHSATLMLGHTQGTKTHKPHPYTSPTQPAHTPSLQGNSDVPQETQRNPVQTVTYNDKDTHIHKHTKTDTYHFRIHTNTSTYFNITAKHTSTHLSTHNRLTADRAHTNSLVLSPRHPL